MVKFFAFQSAKVLDTKALNVTKDVTIEIKILALIKENASITTTEMARQLSVNRRTIQRGLDVLKSKDTVDRRGGKRYGYWEVYE
jgi:ATP-dependent DNA helicase RecG|nr:HTH domain-containing protein [uncultured Schaedlerella sp.]